MNSDGMRQVEQPVKSISNGLLLSFLKFDFIRSRTMFIMNDGTLALRRASYFVMS